MRSNTSDFIWSDPMQLLMKIYDYMWWWNDDSVSYLYNEACSVSKNSRSWNHRSTKPGQACQDELRGNKLTWRSLKITLSTSSPTYPACVNVVQSQIANGTSKHLANVWAKYVLPRKKVFNDFKQKTLQYDEKAFNFWIKEEVGIHFQTKTICG